MKLRITTIVEPATPIKKTISSRRMKKIANAIASTIVAHHSGGTYFLDEASDKAHPQLLKHLPLGIALEVTFIRRYAFRTGQAGVVLLCSAR